MKKLKAQETTVFETAAVGFVALLQEQLLAHGAVETAGKSDEEIFEELNKLCREWAKQRTLKMGTDHRIGLLDRARFAMREEDYDVSCLFYATWFEHWINNVLGTRIKLNHDHRRKMLQEVNLRGKLTWLLALVHSKSIPQNHLNAILKVAELRNSYVHHKYAQVDVNEWENSVKISLEALQAAEKTVNYLIRFEFNHFFDSRTKNLVKKLRKKRQTGLKALKKLTAEFKTESDQNSKAPATSVIK